MVRTPLPTAAAVRRDHTFQARPSRSTPPQFLQGQNRGPRPSFRFATGVFALINAMEGVMLAPQISENFGFHRERKGRYTLP